MKKTARLEICTETRTGSREVNEDSCLALPLSSAVIGLIAVADGIGGLGSGHVASSTASATLGEIFTKLASSYSGEGEPPLLDWLSFCFQKANTAVLKMGLSTPELRGMGTTLTAAALTSTNLYICHIGDSRAYIRRSNTLRQLTEDEWFRGLRNATRDKPILKNARTFASATGGQTGQPAEVTLVTQAIGWQPLIRPAKLKEPLLDGDEILLCTDGLTDALSTQEIEDLIAPEGSVAGICRRLADTAALTPNSDNITVAFARLTF